MPSVPRVRASWSQRLLKVLDRQPEWIRAAVYSRIDPHRADWIRRRGSMTWIPAVDHHELLDAIRRGLPPEAGRILLREVAIDNLGGELVKDAAAGAIRLFGANSRALMRMFPRGFKMVAHDIAEVEVDLPNEIGTAVRFLAIPEVLRTQTFAISMRAVLEACMEIGQVPGIVHMDLSSLRDGEVHLMLRADDHERYMLQAS